MLESVQAEEGKVDLHPDVKIDEHVQVVLVDARSSLSQPARKLLNKNLNFGFQVSGWVRAGQEA